MEIKNSKENLLNVKSKEHHEIYYLLGGWFLINLFSAFYTELSYDESYYWMYSRFPDWGYFDHPPMIAFLDMLGCLLLPGELGVRLFTLLLSCMTIWMLYLIAGKRNADIMALIVASSFPFHIFGFLSIPDVPLLFFCVLFFYSYKIFLEHNRNLYVLLLAFSMASLMYSKYHGIIVIGCTLASNLFIFKNKKFLWAVFIALLLYLPHIYWQYKHDFISLSFHLFDRSSGYYKLNFTWEYLISQPLFYGPLTGLFLFYASWKYRPDNIFERALKYTFVGVFLFFLTATVKGRVEANWTIPALIPMTYFTMRYFSYDPSKLKWLKISAGVSFLILFTMRIVLAFSEKAYVHRMGEMVGWKAYAQEIIKAAGNTPVVANSYQDASKLSFYSGRLIPSLNVNGRRNQFDLWGLSYEFEGKKVLFLNNYLGLGEKIKNPKSDLYYLTSIKHLPVYQGLLPEAAQKYKGGKNDSIKVVLKIYSLSDRFPTYTFPDMVKCYFYKEGKSDYFQSETVRIISNTKDNLSAIIKIQLPGKEGEYQVGFSFYTEGIGEWGTGRQMPLIVE
jgi:4-amino-4-deoxy-L-arabinose transferase-like glycosyltransferase